PTIELAGARPWDLAGTLTLLAEDRYARAGLVLVARAGEWGPPGELRPLVERARRRRRLPAPERVLSGPGGGLLRRLAARPEDQRHADDGLAVREDERRGALLQLGRAARSPTLKEADDLLLVARVLEDWAAGLTSGLAAIDGAERARGRAVSAAQRALAEAEERRQRAISAARVNLDAAEERHAEARREARERLLRAIAPPPGEPLAEVGPLRAFATTIQTPAGRMPAEAVTATAATAGALWAARRDVLLDVVLAETPEAEEFLACLPERPERVFVLLEGRSLTALWPCQDGEEGAARAFAAAVN